MMRLPSHFYAMVDTAGGHEPVALARMLISLVMADPAARAGPEQPVMTGKVPGDTAKDGALQ